MLLNKVISYKGWLTTIEAAKKTGYSERHLRRLAKRKQINAKKVLGLWLIPPEVIKPLKKLKKNWRR